MNKEEIGLALVARRDELRITQARLARVSGVSVHTLSNLETGEGNVTLDTLLKVVMTRATCSRGFWRRAPTARLEPSMLRLDFSLADLSLPPQREKTRRASISGVQDKVQLSRRRGRVEAAVTASRLSSEAKGLYLDKFHDRLMALAQ